MPRHELRIGAVFLGAATSTVPPRSDQGRVADELDRVAQSLLGSQQDRAARRAANRPTAAAIIGGSAHPCSLPAPFVLRPAAGIVAHQQHADVLLDRRRLEGLQRLGGFIGIAGPRSTCPSQTSVVAVVLEGRDVVGLELDRLAIGGQCFVRLFIHVQRGTEIVVGLGRVGVDAERNSSKHTTASPYLPCSRSTLPRLL